jgi:DNA-binding transcriptional LysR family regulator
MQNEIDENQMQANGKIKIASTHAIIHCFLPKPIVRFRVQSPNVVFELKGGEHEKILESVKSAEVDFGIASLNSHSDGIVYHDLFETGLELITPKNNPFFKTKKPTLKQISDVPFIAQPASSTRTFLIQTKFTDMGLNLNVVLVLNNFKSIKKYVELGAGGSIMDDFALTKNDRERLDTYSLDRYFGRKNYGIIIRKKKYLSPPVKAFLRTLKPGIQYKFKKS